MNVNVYAFTLLNHYIFFIYIINETLRFISYIIYELISISMIIIDYWLPRRAPRVTAWPWRVGAAPARGCPCACPDPIGIRNAIAIVRS